MFISPGRQWRIPIAAEKKIAVAAAFESSQPLQGSSIATPMIEGLIRTTGTSSLYFLMSLSPRFFVKVYVLGKVPIKAAYFSRISFSLIANTVLTNSSTSK